MNQKMKCEIHHLPALYFDYSKDSYNKFICAKCMTARFPFQKIEEFNASEQRKFNQINQQGEQTFKQQILQAIEKLLQIIFEIIKKLEEKQSSWKQLFDSIKEYTMVASREHQENIINIIFDITSSLNNDLNALSDISQTNEIFNILKSFDSKTDIEESQKKKVKLEQLDKSSQTDNILTESSFVDKKFYYQLIKKSSYEETSHSSAIAFNKDNTIMIAGVKSLIKVFEFKTDKLKEIQQLNGHTKNVICLLFMKKSNQFISGSCDSTIITWEQQSQNNKWYSIQVLKAHTLQIYTITINQNEDMLISGSEDKSIKFWQRENNTWNSKQSIQCSNCVYSVSLSSNEDKLIAYICDMFYGDQILIIQLQGREWIINQKISIKQNGYRLCFINQNQFVFQSKWRQYLQIYDYDEKEQIYKQGAEVQYQNEGLDVSYLFPIQYIQQMGLILVKNDEYVHLIKRVQNGQYTVEQSIHFGTCFIFGCISDDGKYIATWDQKSKEIQIRKRS